MPGSQLETEEWTHHLFLPLQLSTEGKVANTKKVLELCLIGLRRAHKEMFFFDSLLSILLVHFFPLCFGLYLPFIKFACVSNLPSFFKFCNLVLFYHLSQIATSCKYHSTFFHTVFLITNENANN